MNIIYRSYCLNCAKFIHEAEDTHLTTFSGHALVNYAVTPEYYDTTANDLGFKVGAPTSGTPTVYIQDFDEIEPAILNNGDSITNVSGSLQTSITTVSGDLQSDLTTISGVLQSQISTTDSRRAVNYVFTTGQSGDVKPYAETDSNSYAVVAQIIFPGTDFLGEPSLAQVLVSTQSTGITGTVRLYDNTNAIEIASVVTSSVTMEVINMTVASGSPWPESEAVLEIQSVTSQNNRWTRVATLSLRWN